MYSVTYDQDWGTRLPRRKHTIYFSRRPTDKEVIESFMNIGLKVSEKFSEPHCSGMVVIKEVKVVF